MKEYSEHLQKTMGNMDPSSMPELGDACIAAPFTYKFSSIKAAKKLI